MYFKKYLLNNFVRLFKFHSQFLQPLFKLHIKKKNEKKVIVFLVVYPRGHNYLVLHEVITADYYEF